MIVAMTKSELIQALSIKQTYLLHQDVELSVDVILRAIAHSMNRGVRVEIRGFGNFSVSELRARTGRNPKTGAPVPIAASRMPRFTPGKELRDRIRESAQVVTY
jgi:integration host factor subunit beta